MDVEVRAAGSTREMGLILAEKPDSLSGFVPRAPAWRNAPLRTTPRREPGRPAT